jgi:hypothetical protein
MDATVFSVLNMGALLGWTLILFLLLSQLPLLQSSLPSSSSPSSSLIQEWTLPFFDTTSSSDEDDRMPIIDLLLFLEAICVIEVGRIAIGQLKGNLVLGIVLHMIRMSCLLIVLPAGLLSENYSSSSSSTDNNNNNNTKLILYSWALTEVGRYPMYLFPSSNVARYVRLVLPIVTFPIGAFAEAVGAYWHLKQLLLVGGDNDDDDATATSPSLLHWVKVGLLVMVVGINSILGPTMAYPALLKKGLPVLMGKSKSSTRKKED